MLLKQQAFLTSSFIFISLLLSACIPVLRTEYVSPHWRGTLVDSNTGQVLSNVTVTDLYTLNKTQTDEKGYFSLAAKTTQLSFKLPAASMARDYQLQISLAKEPLTLVGRRLASTSKASVFDLGLMPLRLSQDFAAFKLTEAQPNSVSPIPAKWLQSCAGPIKSAISLTRSARFYRELKALKQKFMAQTVSQTMLKTSYHWAVQAWSYAQDQCFSNDYNEAKAFASFSQAIYKEAEAINKRQAQ